MSEALPHAAVIFVEFAQVLRGAGFAVAPEQTMLFVESVGLLGPGQMQDIYRAARATLAPPPERIDEFDALYRQHFLDATLAAPAQGTDDEDELPIQEARDDVGDVPEATEQDQSGGEATSAEILSVRRFDTVSQDDVLRRFRREAPSQLPKRRSRRFKRSRSGSHYDLKRSLREAVRHGGEVMNLSTLKRRERQRQVLLLIDVSGSMQDYTDSYLRFAHTLASATQRIEVFTLGTRLTRVTRAMRLRNQSQALDAASSVVADFDGGTRLGDALQAFLAVPRFAGFARGAVNVIVSDGLERGDPERLVNAINRLSRLSWRTVWLTPLAGDAGYTPQTDAMVAMSPWLDHIGDASSMNRVCAEVLDIASAA